MSAKVACEKLMPTAKKIGKIIRSECSSASEAMLLIALAVREVEGASVAPDGRFSENFLKFRQFVSKEYPGIKPDQPY